MLRDAAVKLAARRVQLIPSRGRRCQCVLSGLGGVKSSQEFVNLVQFFPL